MSSKVISILLSILAVLSVACVVLMGFQFLLGALHDTVAARALQWIGLGCLIVFVIDLVLLVGVLATRALEQDRSEE